MGKSHLEVPYSSDYEVGSANDTQKSRIQVTMRWDGQTTLRSLVFKWPWGGMGKSLLEFSYSSDYEVGVGRPHLEVSYSSDYEEGWANHS